MMLTTLIFLTVLANLQCSLAKRSRDACKVPEIDCLAIKGYAYRYNAQTNTCEYDSYCSQGSFNHKTQRSCERSCLKNQLADDRPCNPPSEKCKVSKGNTFRYNIASNTCQQLPYCIDGSFNHNTRAACERACVKKPEDPCQVPRVECKAIKGQAFRYNAESNTCSEQNYCAQGSFNHQTLQSCQRSCVKPLGDPCKPPEVECMAVRGSAYRYDEVSNTCRKQATCAEGSFNHKSRRSCERQCVKKEADPCKIPEVECEAIRGTAFRYNEALNICQLQKFCAEGSFNHHSKKACERKCVKTLDPCKPPQSECQAQRGSVYRYDAASNRCKKGTYCATGPFNFLTKVACKKTCVKSTTDSSSSSESMSWADYNLDQYRKRCDDEIFGTDELPSDCISGMEPTCLVKENSPEVWRYDYESGRCLAELVCKAGFSNMFSSKKKCERRCMKKVGGKGGKGKVEKCPRLGSECKAIRGHAWRYNPSSKACQWMAICDLDWPYNFDTQGKCNRACGVKKGVIVSQTSSCSFSPNEPRCLILPPNAPTVWRYDSVDNRCKSTSVCMAGFGNMFNSELSCIRQCVKK